MHSKVAFSTKGESKRPTEGMRLSLFHQSCSLKLHRPLQADGTFKNLTLFSKQLFTLHISRFGQVQLKQSKIMLLFTKVIVNVKTYTGISFCVRFNEQEDPSAIRRCPWQDFDCVWRSLSGRVPQRWETYVRFRKCHSVILRASLCRLYLHWLLVPLWTGK